jgi:hypothetical protein
MAKQQAQEITQDPLAHFSIEQINEMQTQFNATLDAYKAHRSAPERPGVQRGTFNFGEFLKHAASIYNFIAPLISKYGGIQLPSLPPGIASGATQS